MENHEPESNFAEEEKEKEIREIMDELKDAYPNIEALGDSINSEYQKGQNSWFECMKTQLTSLYGNLGFLFDKYKDKKIDILLQQTKPLIKETKDQSELFSANIDEEKKLSNEELEELDKIKQKLLMDFMDIISKLPD